MPRARHLLLALLLWAGAPAVAGACTISATSVAFGAYNPNSATSHAGTGNINVDCEDNRDLFATVSISAGGSGNSAQRQMRSGTSRLNYNLFTSSAGTSIWGTGSGGSSTVTVWGFIRTSRAVYGIIPAGQQVRAGTYTDSLVVTVTF